MQRKLTIRITRRTIPIIRTSFTTMHPRWPISASNFPSSTPANSAVAIQCGWPARVAKLADARDLKCGSCLIIERQSDSCARAWRNGIRSGLKKYLSARRETGDAELLKVGETSKWQSRAKPGETPAGKV